MGLERVCPWCGGPPAATGAPRVVRVRREGVEDQAGGALVTPILLVVMVALYAGAMLAGGASSGDGGALDLMSPGRDLMQRLGLVRTPLVLHGEWWRLIAAIFLHLSLLHLLFNGMALWNLGRAVEADFGRAAFWCVFLISGVAGFAAGLPLAGTALDVPATAGASGGICGLIGAILARRRITDGDFDAPVTRMAAQFALYTLIFGLIMPGVNNVAHGGGFVAGLLLGALYAAAEDGRAAPMVWIATAIAALAVSLAAAWAMLDSAERVAGPEVLRMDNCIREVVTTWQGLGPGEQRGGPDIACLTATVPFRDEPEAMDALRGLRVACERLGEALDAGDARMWDAALTSLDRHFRDWRGWIAHNLDRFELRFQ